MYQPKGAENLKDKKFTQVRLGLQGDSGFGKTFSTVRTFPNPIVADFDNKLNAFANDERVVRIPFCEEDFIKEYGFPVLETQKLMHGTKYAAFVNRRDAFRRWLQEEGLKLTNEQTLIIDSWTSLQNAFDIETDTRPPRITSGGKEDDFDFWKKKIAYNEAIVTLLKACKCHVVVTFHELPMRDPKTNLLVEKIGPLMQGGFVKQLKSHFTDWYRAVKQEQINKDGVVTGEKYWWQVRSDNKFDGFTTLHIPQDIVLVEPHFKIFQLYSKPISPSVVEGGSKTKT